MWTSTLDLSPRRVFVAQLLGRAWTGAYFSSFAPLRVQNLPRQSLQSTTWVRVRNRLAGVCGSDLHLVYADGDLRIAPAALPAKNHHYLGHEVVGEVIERGEDVQYLNIGDRVVLQYGPNCIATGVQQPCHSCANGHFGLCERGVLPGPTPIGGGWSEEMLLFEQQLFRVPPALHDEQAVLLEPTSVAVHAVLRHLPKAGDRVLIIGAGTIGLLILQTLRTCAPDIEISVQARYPFQIEKATRMGASHIIYPQDSYQGVKQATNATVYTGFFGNKMMLGGYDVIYDTIGSRKTLHHALRWARANGTVVLVGLSLHMMHIDLTPIWYQEINLIGTFGQGVETWPIGSNQQRSTFDVTTELILQGRLHPEQLITHYFALTNYRNALMTATRKGENRAIKVVFDYALLPATVVPNVRASARQLRPHSSLTPAAVDAGTSDDVARGIAPLPASEPVPRPQADEIPMPDVKQYIENPETQFIQPQEPVYYNDDPEIQSEPELTEERFTMLDDWDGGSSLYEDIPGETFSEDMSQTTFPEEPIDDRVEPEDDIGEMKHRETPAQANTLQRIVPDPKSSSSRGKRKGRR